MKKFHIFDAVLAPADGGGYSVEIPALPGCFTCGDSYADAVAMAADAIMTYTASMLRHGEAIPGYDVAECPEGCKVATIAVVLDESYIVEGDVVSASQAARELNLSPGRITHMLDSGKLDGYRSGRRTYVTRASIEARLAESPKAGRPRKRDSVEPSTEEKVSQMKVAGGQAPAQSLKEG